MQGRPGGALNGCVGHRPLGAFVPLPPRHIGEQGSGKNSQVVGRGAGRRKKSRYPGFLLVKALRGRGQARTPERTDTHRPGAAGLRFQSRLPLFAVFHKGQASAALPKRPTLLITGPFFSARIK